jgi:heat shock protein HtpX
MANGIKTALLLGLMSAVLLALGEWLGGANGLVIAFVFAAIMNFGSYWFSDKIVLSMYRAQQVGPDHQLYRIVERLTQRAGLPMPKVYIIPDASPNAFATGRNPIMMVARMAHFAALFGGYGGRGDDRDRGSNPIALLAMMILAPLAAMLIQMAISRSRVFAADAGGASIAGNPYGLADALRKIDAVSKRVPLDANPATAHMFIVKPFSGGGLTSLFSSHPPTDARIRALLGGVG